MQSHSVSKDAKANITKTTAKAQSCFWFHPILTSSSWWWFRWRCCQACKERGMWTHVETCQLCENLLCSKLSPNISKLYQTLSSWRSFRHLCFFSSNSIAIKCNKFPVNWCRLMSLVCCAWNSATTWSRLRWWSLHDQALLRVVVHCTCSETEEVNTNRREVYASQRMHYH